MCSHRIAIILLISLCRNARSIDGLVASSSTSSSGLIVLPIVGLPKRIAASVKMDLAIVADGG